MMRRRDLLMGMAAASALPGGAATYQADWSSLDSRPIPAWYTEAKFGIFIHWGVYSVPAFAPVNVKAQTPYAEWYWNSLRKGNTLTAEFHNRVYGTNFRYPDFAPCFRAELWDPDAWADLFTRSGAKYVALTSKHHDGFALWPSAEADRTWGRAWNSVSTGPKRDLLSELSSAGRRRGLHMGIYYSLYEWFNPLWLRDQQRYVTEHMIPQFKDVVTRAKPSIIFSDGEWELPSEGWHSPELLAWLYNESPVREEVVVNDRWGKETRHRHGGYYTTEYTSGLQQSSHAWEENRGIGFSYGYNRMESLKDYRTDRELLWMLIDIVSRGGNLLLDIGPTADGRVPVVMQERLTRLGEWLQVNGEAIYGTTKAPEARQWSSGQPPKLEDKQFMSEYDINKLVETPASGFARVDVFFTRKPGVTYAIVPRRPVGEIMLKGVGAGRVTLLETGQPVQALATGGGLALRISPDVSAALPARNAYVFKIVAG